MVTVSSEGQSNNPTQAQSANLNPLEREIIWLGEEHRLLNVYNAENVQKASNHVNHDIGEFIQRHASSTLRQHITDSSDGADAFKSLIVKVVRVNDPIIMNSFQDTQMVVRKAIDGGYRRVETKDFLPPFDAEKSCIDTSEVHENSLKATSDSPQIGRQKMLSKNPNHLSKCNADANDVQHKSGEKRKKTDEGRLRTKKDAKKLKFEVKRHEVGDKVYACWLGDCDSESDDKQWYSATVIGKKHVDKGFLGERATTYHILFDDGDEDDSLDDVFVMSRCDYFISLKQRINDKEDPNDKEFAYIEDALRTHDDNVVEEKGRETTKDNLKRPEEWKFAEGRAPVRILGLSKLNGSAKKKKNKSSQSKARDKKRKERRLIEIDGENKKTKRASEHLDKTPPTSITGNLTSNQKQEQSMKNEQHPSKLMLEMNRLLVDLKSAHKTHSDELDRWEKQEVQHRTLCNTHMVNIRTMESRFNVLQQQVESANSSFSKSASRVDSV